MARLGLSVAWRCALAIALASPTAVLTTLGAEAPPGSGTFGPAGTLGQARSGHTVTMLPDGRVLVVGGKSGGADFLDSAELWDPAGASFGWTGRLAEARTRHSASPLPDGRILVVGGESASGPIATAELWDPASDSFTPAGTLSVARSNHTATLLHDGRILVVGGEDELGPIASVEMWDPASDSFTSAGTLGRARSNHTATLLPDGRAIVIGGDGEDGDVATAELWDPASDTFGPAGTLSVARSDHTATLLSDGRVLVVGGLDDGYSDPTATTELWDPTLSDFDSAGPMAGARYWHTATPLPDGRVLIAGGLGTDESRLASAELWHPSVGVFEPAGTMSEARGSHAATLLPDGRVLIVGGLGDDGRLGSAEVWQFSPADLVATPPPGATPTPEPTHAPSRRAMEAGLAESMDWASWEPYRQSPAEAAFDPFETGAAAAVMFDDLEQELHEAIDYIVLFRFPDASSLDDHWEERAGAAASVAPPRAVPCRDGRPGRGRWSAGEYLCYVSDSGTALMRWTDERTETYGVMNAVAGRTNLKTLYRQWRTALRGTGAGQEPSADRVSPPGVVFNLAERLLLRGIPSRIERSCVPLRTGLPAGTIASVRCAPDGTAIGSATYHLMERTKAGRAFRGQVERVFGDGLEGFGLRCDQGRPSWEPSIPYGSDACFLGEDGRAELRIVAGVTAGCTQLKVAGEWLREPVVYMVVRGEDGDIAGLFDAAGPGAGRAWRPFRQKGSPPSDMCPH